MGSGERLPERPARRGHVVGDKGAAVARGDLKREALPVEIGVVLPILPPVSGHGLPPCPGPFDGNCLDIAGAAHVGDEY